MRWNEDGDGLVLFERKIGAAGGLVSLAVFAAAVMLYDLSSKATPAYEASGSWPFGYRYHYLKQCEGDWFAYGPFRVKATNALDAEAFLKARTVGCTIKQTFVSNRN